MNPVQYILICLVRLYRWTLSPAKMFLFGPQGHCRFTPSCSQYALDALRSHGALAGSWIALKRIARCHPWGGCGHDPVPEPVARGTSKIEHRTPNVEGTFGESVRSSEFDVRSSMFPGSSTAARISCNGTEPISHAH